MDKNRLEAFSDGIMTGKIKVNQMRLTISILVLFVTIGACQGFNEGGQSMSNMTTTQTSVFPKGDRGPADYFTGTTWVKMLHADSDGSFDTQAYDVIFEPSARTFWHSHPGGQILLVTHGTGYYQEKGKPARALGAGDVVAIPADVVHWHGAAPESTFVHIGMSTKVHLGPAAWSGPVTDEEYHEATRK